MRKKLRAGRREHVAALDDLTRGLLFRRPPSPVIEMVPEKATIGLYHPVPTEAPTAHYARFFHEAGYPIALPRFPNATSPMEFAVWTDPWDDDDLVVGPFGALQPENALAPVVPDVVFVPLLGFTESGARLGQGGGHYDRWLGDHSGSLCIGLAWDVQKVDMLPLEPHDRLLDAIVTPTRLYGPFERKQA